MQQGPSKEADDYSANQYSTYFVWSPKAEYCVCNSPAMVSGLSQFNPIHALTPFTV
jgi:hypothetical protein